MKVVYTALAQQHLTDLHSFISLRANEDRADDYIDRIVAFCDGLATFPLRGMARDDILPGLRVTGFERRVTIAFIVTDDAILVEGVFYGGRDFAALLGDRR